MQSMTLGLVFENAVLFHQVVDDGLPASIGPAGKKRREEMKVGVARGWAADARDAFPAPFFGPVRFLDPTAPVGGRFRPSWLAQRRSAVTDLSTEP